ncbi:transcriptional activator DEMETER isoform X1 [Tripterygium wilfordii]|uniref:Transcriptional activator DEMETER isoform X1 n=1 Tax=Tripterygium wilfordii TaxID=458696 RepID=A0A7J7C6Q1_TRIWF|nr:transcriptional activator DEMETER isoform X2 [Tripterygium wilfordii]KAF5729436.1 transcriptional activator DEMETER isoform X1 [Tripterygium wilfordii]
MNYGEGFLVPPDKELQLMGMGSWIPLTPQKPIQARSNLMPERHGNQTGSVKPDLASNPMTEMRGNQMGMENWQGLASNSMPESRGNQMGRANWQDLASNPMPQRHANQMGEVNWQDLVSNPMLERHGNQMGRVNWQDLPSTLTPERQIGRANWQDLASTLTPERHGNQIGRANLQELAGFHSIRGQEVPNYNPVEQAFRNGSCHGDSAGSMERYNGVVQNFSPVEQAFRNGNCHGDSAGSMERNRRINQIAGAHRQAFIDNSDARSSIALANYIARRSAASISSANRNLNGNTSIGTERNLSGSISMGTGHLIPNPNSQLSDWGDSSLTSFLLANRSQFSGRNLSTSISSIPQNNQCRFPLQYQPDHNLNLLPRAEADQASCSTTSVQFTPQTPDGAKVENNRLLMIQNFSMDKNSNQQKEKQKEIIIIEDEADEHSSDRLLHNIVDSSSAIASIPLEDNQGFDLNETPPQKPPKRRKHRPKVFVEGKPKRNSSAATTKNSESKQKPNEKRKYVCKNGMNQSATEGAFVRVATDPLDGATAKSCRRTLNFSSEKAGDEKQISIVGQKEINPTNKQVPDFNADFQAREFSSGTDILCRTKSALQSTQQDAILPQIQQPGTTSSIAPAMKQMPRNFFSMSEAPGSLSHQLPTKSIQTENSIVDPQIVDPRQKSSKNGFPPILQMHAEQFGRLSPQARAISPSSESTKMLMPKSTLHSVPKFSSNSNPAGGSKRAYSHTIEQTPFHDINTTASSMFSHKTFQLEDCRRESNILRAGYFETHKKKKIENGFQTTYKMPSCSAAFEVTEGWGEPKTKGTNDDLYVLSSQPNHGFLHSIFESEQLLKRENNGVSLNNSNVESITFGKILPKQNIRYEQHSCMESMGVSSNNFSKLTTIDEHHLLPPTLPRKTCNVNVSVRQETQESAPSHSITRVPPKKKDASSDHHQPSARRRGRPVKQTYPISVDQIIYRLNDLNLKERTNESAGQEQNALVPYKADGTIVPYQGLGFLKKRKPRPKVDLDLETNRLWNLLMGKEGPKSLEGTDRDKEKWWEEERKIFRGRVDSFIARMHLVQGDRRFSQWKGSVIDSVIGVFLTQNVSDHLSSSAFMSLAARFPLKSKSDTTYDKDGTHIFVEEPEVYCLQNPNETIKWHDNASSQLCNKSSSTPHKMAKKSTEGVTPVKEGTSSVEAASHAVEEVISSQDSFDSLIIQGIPGIRSCSGSNSEAEDPTIGSECNEIRGSTFTNLLLMDSNSLLDEFFIFENESSLFHERPHGQQCPRSGQIDDQKCSNSILQMPVIPSNDLLHMTSNSELMGIEALEFYDEESISSWRSATSGVTKAIDDNITSKRDGQVAESVSRSTARVNKPTRVEDSITNPYATVNKHPFHQQSISEAYHDSYLSEMSKPLHLESTSVTQPINLADTLSKGQTGGTECISNVPEFPGKTFDVEGGISKVNKQIRVENKLVEQNSRQNVHSTVTGPRKAKKAKVEHENNNAIDWDNLRKQVDANGRKKEKNKDAMDSLDYEAVRCADVKEISDAIKERGMNNMLAERMKEFLNRMVAEHGSIDLEWLRDVNPDKAKDYLLSIRGLGLKSVECVRLLTLHHLAFPVDTNVGRIAVRLGWVPLQPLPESLQLHLLELYPVLESIQKYLWPRLCKLDQRTLYELHYQMITFGKVFCTKNKPNCNACPMRAECRHFASAFASARLALPGPEERSLANSVVPITSQKNAAVLINPVPLPLIEENSLKMALSDVGSCEPIIEEPATPEPEHSEITESNIEDSFWEDPDEIPTIKLNIDEFTASLQTYMHENMELQDGDLSKALVALNPAAASIPTPKLKNISRLRTEHHVYELPDSHPLLKRMERREPDDPSPYLLAIWTPGETANSIQAPDQQCKSQGPDKLCNDKTCLSCNSIREANSQTVRGTILIPCRTAMRGSFPLNGTYFQVNEMFADHESSVKPIDVPRAWIWNLPRRIVFFGTSVSTIFKGLSTEGIQYCFWKGFVCVRGFDQTTRAPRPLLARLHFPASKMAKKKEEVK